MMKERWCPYINGTLQVELTEEQRKVIKQLSGEDFDGPSYEERERIKAETLRRQDSFNQSIRDAQSNKVEEEKILHNVDEIDNYFMN